MAKRTANFNSTGIDGLPDNKPVVYKIVTEGGKTNYIGTAQRGRVRERLQEHLPGKKDPIPGAKVQIQQMPSIAEALRTEARAIRRSKPKYNQQGEQAAKKGRRTTSTGPKRK